MLSAFGGNPIIDFKVFDDGIVKTLDYYRYKTAQFVAQRKKSKDQSSEIANVLSDLKDKFLHDGCLKYNESNDEGEDEEINGEMFDCSDLSIIAIICVQINPKSIDEDAKSTLKELFNAMTNSFANAEIELGKNQDEFNAKCKELFMPNAQYASLIAVCEGKKIEDSGVDLIFQNLQVIAKATSATFATEIKENELLSRDNKAGGLSPKHRENLAKLYYGMYALLKTNKVEVEMPFKQSQTSNHKTSSIICATAAVISFGLGASMIGLFPKPSYQPQFSIGIAGFALGAALMIASVALYVSGKEDSPSKPPTALEAPKTLQYVKCDVVPRLKL